MATIIGIFSALALFGIALFNKGGFGVFFDFDSVLITIGGTIASTLVAFPLPIIFKIFKVLRKAFSKEIVFTEKTIYDILKCSITARKESFLALENLLDTIDNEILKKGITLIVEGYNLETIKDILEVEIIGLEERHEQGEKIFRYMGKMSPAFGMIGTLIGLIAMLKSLSSTSPEGLGPAMSTALITTFYGAMLANLVCIPIAEKLSAFTEIELLENKLAMEGVLMIYQGINPRVIEKKLNSYLPKEFRRDFFEKVKNVKKEEK